MDNVTCLYNLSSFDVFKIIFMFWRDLAYFLLKLLSLDGYGYCILNRSVDEFLAAIYEYLKSVMCCIVKMSASLLVCMKIV